LTTFGFSIPQGSAAELETAASSCRGGGLGLVLQGNGIAQGSKIAVGGWQGEAQAAFAERAGQASSVLLANADAFTNAGTTIDRLAGELWRAQKLTRQAAKDCQSYQQQLNAAQQAADQHAQDAQNLSAQAQLAAHPHAQAKLNHQATLACDQAQAAQGQANQARAQLESAQKQGRDADHAYQQQADEVKGQIQAAGAEIHTIPHLPTPIPINITPADINLAKKMLHGAGNLANAAKAATNPALLKRLAGQNLTPAAVAAFLHDLQVAERDAPKPQRGSLIDAAGGFLNTFTFGALSFGNPNTARYRGGELAAMIPADPDALVVDGVDGGRDAAKLAEDLGDDAGEGGVPANVEQTLREIDQTGSPPQGYRGGGAYVNDGRGGSEVLPTSDADGNPIAYKEYDMNPYTKGVNRGPERIVVGSNGSAYYTSDHYRTFTPIR
jgi:guanyl-specific ribonuclease Sa